MQITCPKCHTVLEAAPGTPQIRCSVCGQVINVPAVDATTYTQPAMPYNQASPTYAPAPQGKSSSTTILLIIIAALLAAVIGAGVVYLLMNKGGNETTNTVSESPVVIHDTIRETQTVVQQVPTQAPPAQTQAPATSYNASGQGLYPFASTRRLSASELYGYSARQLKIMRNEIYARHGYIFQTADMKSYFGAQPWYRPVSRNVSLSSIEQANVATIKSVEATK